jgi:AraC-like DNA-binding protein
MSLNDTRSGHESLERSCKPTADWVTSTEPVGGIALLSAWFAGVGYDKHRHDTYAIGLTDCGVQVFDYRGEVRTSMPGQVVVLYPDELHDGRAGTVDGFGYRIIYVDPAHLSEALQTLCGRSYPLPFVRDPVSTNTKLAQAIRRAFQSPLEALAIDSLVLDLAEGLLDDERNGGRLAATQRVDVPMIERARQFLDAERTRVVHSTELESITGLTRYQLARQFKRLLGTSPYRYLTMRRLEFARQLVHQQRPLAEVAYESGFADQAHFTRTFKSAFGLTPARYRALRANQISR